MTTCILIVRDLDFKHNLEQKQKIVARVEELVNEADVNKALENYKTCIYGKRILVLKNTVMRSGTNLVI
jgi:hypothetical protein